MRVVLMQWRGRREKPPASESTAYKPWES